jgi:DNA-binding CsgD family transcriptional regulator
MDEIGPGPPFSLAVEIDDEELLRSLLAALRGRPEFRLVSTEDEIPTVIVTDRADLETDGDGDASILIFVGAQATQSAVRPVAAVLPTKDARLILSAAHVIAAGYAVRLAGARGDPQDTITNERDALAEPRRADLSSREREVLELLVEGASNKEIARRLGISVHTAKFHVAAVLGAIGAKNRSDAVAIGFRDGYISM